MLLLCLPFQVTSLWQRSTWWRRTCWREEPSLNTTWDISSLSASPLPSGTARLSECVPSTNSPAGASCFLRLIFERWMKGRVLWFWFLLFYYQLHKWDIFVNECQTCRITAALHVVSVDQTLHQVKLLISFLFTAPTNKRRYCRKLCWTCEVFSFSTFRRELNLHFTPQRSPVITL